MPISAGPIERAGFTDTPVTDDMNCRQGEAYRHSRKADEMHGRALLRHAKDDNQEQKCRDDFKHKGGEPIVLAKIPRAPASPSRRQMQYRERLSTLGRSPYRR